MARVTLLYFAKVREVIGFDREEVDLPDHVTTPAALADWLSGRGPAYAAALADRTRLRCALDQHMAPFDAPLGEAQEIAFFPPVTGG